MNTVDVHFVCCKCDKLFIRSTKELNSEAKWKLVNEWLAEKSPRCEDCATVCFWTVPAAPVEPVELGLIMASLKEAFGKIAAEPLELRPNIIGFMSLEDWELLQKTKESKEDVIKCAENFMTWVKRP